MDSISSIEQGNNSTHSLPVTQELLQYNNVIEQEIEIPSDENYSTRLNKTRQSASSKHSYSDQLK
jgi:hypothetical protein